VRKLLVASQKGGVGKTTVSVNLATAAALAGSRVLLLDADPLSTISTSLNLAGHPQRKSLRQLGTHLPGVMISEVVPGLDLLCPYDEGGCPDEAFDDLLQALAAPGLQECYGTMIVNSPPFMGTNPSQLVGSCDEFVLVIRAEAMAYRTLPAFMQLMQRARQQPDPIQMRGILLTLPAGELAGCRWERELRGRFGSRVLPEVIPHDEEVARALMASRIVTQATPDSPAARQYRHVVENLGLAEKGRGGPPGQVTAALRTAASSIQAAGKTVRYDARAPAAVAGESPAFSSRSRPITPRSRPLAPAETVPDRKIVPETVAEPRPLPRDPIVPRRSGARAVAAAASLPSSPPVTPSRSLPPAPNEASVLPPPRPSAVAPSGPRSTPQPALQRPPAPLAPRQHLPAGSPPAQLAPLWMALGMTVGVGLRFVPASSWLLPGIVGGAVAAVVILLIWKWGRAEKALQPNPAAPAPAPKPARPESKADAAIRLQALTPRATRPRKGESPGA
jgi:chromosome partitioning protein